MAEVAAEAGFSKDLPSKIPFAKPINSADPGTMNLKAPDPSIPHTAAQREVGIPNDSPTPSNTLNMSNGHQSPSQVEDVSQGIDPISRQIIARTQSQQRATQNLNAANSSFAPPGPSEEPQPGTQVADPGIRNVDSAPGGSTKSAKDKKKGVSFLSRIMGAKKRDDSLDPVRDNGSEVADNRPAGTDAEVFSQPLGFIPRFPAPPKYIKVKTQNRKQKDFDRLFLAQVLLADGPPKTRIPSDAKIMSINDTTEASPAKSSPIWAMKWSHDGHMLAAAGQDKKLRVWSVISSPEDRESEETCPDNQTDDGNNVKLNAPVFKVKLLREYDGHTSSILDVCWSKNNFLLSSSMDKTVRLYHVSRPECLCAFKHNDFVTSIQFHPRDDRFFLAGSLDSKLRLWSIPDKSVAYWAQVPDMVTAVAFTPDGKTALAGCLNGQCILYDTEGLKAHSQINVRSASLRARSAKGSKITGIDTISLPREDGHHDVKLLITSNDSRIRMYNLKYRNLEIKFKGLVNACSQIHASFSDDGKYVICGSEDRKVYIWPTGPVEKQDQERRPVEIFEAHSTIVTSALLAPTKTRQLLAQSGDPIYDLCNPPPVTLRIRSDSLISSRAPTDTTGHSGKEQDREGKSRQSDSPRRAVETPAYLARNAHPGGNIIVTADYTGTIKIFRQDCAYLKRKQETWDSSSVFSKRMLSRSASVNTRNSVTSSTNATRHSANLSTKNHETDRIINWRNSIASTHANGSSHRSSVSETNLRSSTTVERPRSTSPHKRSFSHRFLLGHSSTLPNANSSSNSKRKLTASPPHSPTEQTSPSTQPQIAVVSPGPITAEPESMIQDDPSLTPAQNPNAPAPKYNPAPHDPNDPLFLQGSQSFMFWNVKNNLGSMVNQPPRSPGLLSPMRSTLSREGSVVSQLSSEVMSSEGNRSVDEAG